MPSSTLSGPNDRTARAVPLPAYKPQIATAAHVAPDGYDYLHEPKLRGHRIGCAVHNGQVRLHGQAGRNWTSKFPGIARAASTLAVKRALLDGVIVAQSTHAAVDQPAPPDGGPIYCVFDLLHVDGHEVAALPLEQRKELLRSLIARSYSDQIRYVEHVVGEGRRAFERAWASGHPGLVSKQRHASHRGGRSLDWLQVKPLCHQEFAIGGFCETPSRSPMSSLFIGYPHQGGLRFAGEVTLRPSFTPQAWLELRADLSQLARKTCPFRPQPRLEAGRSLHWVRPLLVAEVQFIDWTRTGRLRGPALVGLCRDATTTAAADSGTAPAKA